MTTDFVTHSPQKDYTATVQLTGTKDDLAVFYNLLNRADTTDERERRMKDDMLNELRCAYSWISDMESVERMKT